MKKINLLLLAFSAISANSVFAATGTIDFSGVIVATTCTAVLDSTSSATGTVTLPTIPTSSLNQADATAGAKLFTITLSQAASDPDDDPVACAQSGSFTATPIFEAEPAKVNAAGRIINLDDDTGATVDIQLLTNANEVIDINAGVAQSVSTPTGASGAPQAFNYIARYYAKNAAVAGPVTGSVSYSIAYK